MPRYYFNLYNDMDTVDEEGAELQDLGAAKDMAIRGARELMGDHVRHGRSLTLSHRVEITDSQGTVLAIIPFRELITIVD
jgi:hypothetical protein